MKRITHFIIFTIAVSLSVIQANGAQLSSSLTSNDMMLESFQAEVGEQAVTLGWRFNRVEKGVRVFVERAGLDMQFAVVSNEKNLDSGMFVDVEPEKGLSFYRLVTQHPDGSTGYHYTIMVSND